MPVAIEMITPIRAGMRVFSLNDKTQVTFYRMDLNRSKRAFHSLRNLK